MRLAVLALEQMAAKFLEPLLFDGGDATRKEPRGLDQLGGDDPFTGLARPRARVHPELDGARAGVITIGFIAHADVAEQAGEERAMDRAVAFGLLRIHRGTGPAHFFQRPAELLVDIRPFAHPRIGEEIIATQPPQPRLGLQLPQLEKREEIGALVGKAGMTLVGGGGALEGSLARILHR